MSDCEHDFLTGLGLYIQQIPSGVAIYVNTQVVPYDSQGNTARVTTNQALEYKSKPTYNQRGLSL